MENTRIQAEYREHVRVMVACQERCIHINIKALYVPIEMKKMTAKLTAKPVENHGKWETSVDKDNAKNGSTSRIKKTR